MTVHLAIAPLAPPQTRGDCVDAVRPCPWAGCRHHILAAAESCTLDVASRGTLSSREIGLLLRISHGRVQQIEEIAKAKLKKRLDADMLSAWTQISEDSADANASDALDAEFKAGVQAAYERIVPAGERGKNAIRSAKGRTT